MNKPRRLEDSKTRRSVLIQSGSKRVQERLCFRLIKGRAWGSESNCIVHVSERQKGYSRWVISKAAGEFNRSLSIAAHYSLISKQNDRPSVKICGDNLLIPSVENGPDRA